MCCHVISHKCDLDADKITYDYQLYLPLLCVCKEKELIQSKHIYVLICILLAYETLLVIALVDNKAVLYLILGTLTILGCKTLFFNKLV